MKPDHFKSLTEILMSRVTLTDDGLSHIKDILSQLKTVKLKFPYIRKRDNEFYANFLQLCTNMKRLCIQGGPIIGADASWLRRKYPKLKHFELNTLGSGEISELPIFFKQNYNIKSFATSVEDILWNKHYFTNSSLNLDVLSIFYDRTELFNSSRNILNDLHGTRPF